MAVNSIYEEIKNAVDISDIIGERVRLKRASRGYVGLCPFHSEDTPSFHVYTDTQSYYCFGCKEAGDVYTYLMKTEGITFREALEILSERTGIKLPDPAKKSESITTFEILMLMSEFYHKNLKSDIGRVARLYAEGRKIDANDIEKFSLGYALNSWDSLVIYLRKKGISDKTMLDLGLASKGRNGLYDRFRGRLIFPIKNVSGNVIGFGGRLIDGDGAKYINSSESKIFKKGNNLYLLNEAKTAIHEKKRAIIVEGYVDAIKLHKAGFKETVASLGTSLTSEHAKILSRFTDVCYVCYDNDDAGRIAALKNGYILAENGLEVRVISIPDYKDPDEFLSVQSSQDFEKLITDSQSLILHHINILKPSVRNRDTRKAALRELFAGLSRLDVTEVLTYKQYLSELTGAPPSRIIEYFSGSKTAKPHNNTISKIKSDNLSEQCEAGLCNLLYKYQECRLMLSPQEATRLLRSEQARMIAKAFLTESPESQKILWLDVGNVENIGFLTRGEEYCQHMAELTPVEKFSAIYDALKYRYVNAQITLIRRKMMMSEATNDELRKVSELRQELEAIKNESRKN